MRGLLLLPELRRPSRHDTPKIIKPVCQHATLARQPPNDKAVARIIDLETTVGTHQVREAGPHQLWRIIEDTHATWLTMDQPGWERFGLTTTATTQQIWLDEPRNVLRNSACAAHIDHIGGIILAQQRLPHR